MTVGGSAGILLQAGVGNTAFALRNRTVLVLATNVDCIAGSVADAFDIDDAGGGNGNEAENDGGDRELHFED